MDSEGYSVLVIGAAGWDTRVVAREPEIALHQSNPAQIWGNWGGLARNIAENLARLGSQTQLITAVGDDDTGRQLLVYLNTLGVNTEGSLTVSNGVTGSFVALHNVDEQLWVAFDDMQIVQEITPGYLYRHRRFFKEIDMICIDANLSERTLDTVFRLARQHDVPICADPTTPLLAPRLRPFLPRLTAITPSRREAEALLQQPLTGSEALLNGARSLVQMGVELAIITLGAEGLVYATTEESGRLPAFEAEVVDRVGAGDALTAAVAYGLMEGFD
ncbi:MAG: carbohydrate kinase family protein, partial [Anaerolineae bacterium]